MSLIALGGVDEFKVIDISVTLRKSLASWPGENFWNLEPVARMERGDPCNVSKFTMGAHLGTHVDSPWHFGSAGTVESLPMDQLITSARVLDMTYVEDAICSEDLEGKLDGISAVLLKTQNSGRLEAGEPFDKQFIHLDPSAADFLLEKKITTVGVDYLSVEGFHVQGAPVHHKLLGNNVLIVEGLDLLTVEPRDYLLVVLPLKIEGADGAPARAVLLDSIIER